ncbi:MAG: hypothetical protein ACK5LV_03465 [Lachnospirales bacterium]
MSPFVVNVISVVMAVLAIFLPLIAIYNNKFVLVTSFFSTFLCSVTLFAQIYVFRIHVFQGNDIEALIDNTFIATGVFLIVITVLNVVSIIFYQIKMGQEFKEVRKAKKAEEKVQKAEQKAEEKIQKAEQKAEEKVQKAEEKAQAKAQAKADKKAEKELSKQQKKEGSSVGNVESVEAPEVKDAVVEKISNETETPTLESLNDITPKNDDVAN